MISQNKQKGFTIVELLIVIVVIGILAAISIVAYNGVTQKARDDQRLADARNIVNAAASYQAENGSWPTVGQVQGYNTVKLTGNAAGTLLSATAPTQGGTNEDRYGYVFCEAGSGSGTVAADAATGIQVTYWKSADNTAQTVKAGSGDHCE
ncbi:prepilin-type cleavage/methylation domain-containing protein [Candidatus Saccharibacteria bacterium]|nr:MAG: prepilin-type cleavage/methylation domain-containing protein [Candidatus Saccharibacteria bacterium]